MRRRLLATGAATLIACAPASLSAEAPTSLDALLALPPSPGLELLLQPGHRLRLDVAGLCAELLAEGCDLPLQRSLVLR